MKNIFLLIIVLLLAWATWFFVFNENFSAVTSYDTQFQLTDAPKRTTRIEIIDIDGRKIELTKSEKTGNWFCNKYYLAREDAVNKILQVVSDWKMDKPISKKGVANIKEKLFSNGKQIKYYYDYKHEEPVKHFYINGSPPNRNGAYMILKGAENPYLVRSPGIIGSPEIMFHSLLEKWRTHRIFGGTGDDIKNLKVTFSEDETKSFEIIKDDKKRIGLAKKEGVSIPKEKIIDNLSLKVTLDKVAKLNVEAFDNSFSKREEIVESPFYCQIAIESYEPELSQTVNIYRMPINDKSKMINMPDGEKQLYDVDRFFATINKGKDFVIIQQFAFDDILTKKYEDFFIEEK